MVKTNSLVSVIVPIYNSEPYLDKCVNSILDQTHTNLEIILVNDGSKDRSPMLCDEYAERDSRIKVVHKPNGGLSSARNAGLNVCTGDYIGFVDSDDWINAAMYESLLSISEEQKSIATIGMQEVTISGERKGSLVWEDHTASREVLLRRILCHEDGGSVCSRLFSRDVIGANRFDEGKLNEDVLFMVEVIANAEHLAYCSAIGYNYFVREKSISRHFGKSIHDMIDNAKRIRIRVERDFPALSRVAERFEIYQHMNFLLCCPSDYNRREDPLCGEVLAYTRRHVMRGLKNPHLSPRQKMKLAAVAMFPKTMSGLVEKKFAKKKE